ncbi:unnamed protein product [Heterobilharzia americana]|nr:unnamed protein product [Heterobilharzia americana]
MEKRRNYLIFTLKKNGYPRNFIRRCLYRASPTTKSSTEINKRIVLPYIKNVSEITTRLLRPLEIAVAHEPTNSLQTLLCRPKDATSKEDKPNIIYKINRNNCGQHYIGQSGHPLRLRLHEHQSAIKRHDISSLISMHVDNYGHEFNFDNVEILDRGNTKNVREFLEAWHSGQSVINRCIDIDPIYQPIRKMINDRKVRGEAEEQPTGKSIQSMTQQSKETTNHRPHRQSKPLNHSRRDIDSSLHTEVSADDVV